MGRENLIGRVIDSIPVPARAGLAVVLAATPIACSSGGNGEPGISIDCTAHTPSSASLYKGQSVPSSFININADSSNLFYAALGSGTSTLNTADGVTVTVEGKGISVASRGHIRSLPRLSGDVVLVTSLPGTLQTDNSAHVGCSEDLKDASAKAELNDTNVNINTVYSVDPDDTVSKLNPDGTTSPVVG